MHQPEIPHPMLPGFAPGLFLPDPFLFFEPFFGCFVHLKFLAGSCPALSDVVDLLAPIAEGSADLKPNCRGAEI